VTSSPILPSDHGGSSGGSAGLPLPRNVEPLNSLHRYQGPLAALLPKQKVSSSWAEHKGKISMMNDKAYLWGLAPSYTFAGTPTSLDKAQV